jgi:hypothetical protein
MQPNRMSQTDEYMAALICQQMLERRCTVFALTDAGAVMPDIVPLFLADTCSLTADVYQMVQQLVIADVARDVAAFVYFWRHDDEGVSVVVVARDGAASVQSYRHHPVDMLVFDGVIRHREPASFLGRPTTRLRPMLQMETAARATSTAFLFAAETLVSE